MKKKKQPVDSRKDEKVIQDTVGVKDYEFALSLITSASSAIEPFTGKEEGLIAVLQSLRDMKPRDSMEARLIAQSAVLYEFAMKSLKQCGTAEGVDFIQAMGNLGIKLMRVHNETIETLNRYRRGGEQKISVTHAVVAGQAIVNNNYGEGGFPKKSGDTPCTQGNAEQKQEPMEIAHAETLQWPMGGAECTAEKAQVRGRKKGKKS